MRYPNPADPLNGEAAALMAREPAGYTTKIKDYVRRYATDSSSAISASPIGRFDDMVVKVAITDLLTERKILSGNGAKK